MSRSGTGRPLAGGATLALFLPLLTGPEMGGVARWLPAGPVSLHSGALLLPLMGSVAASAGKRHVSLVLSVGEPRPGQDAQVGAALCTRLMAISRLPTANRRFSGQRDRGLIGRWPASRALCQAGK